MGRGSQGGHLQSLPHHMGRMVVKSGGNWKRPVNRMYTYNFQIGENYYLPMTSYLETKTGASSDVPGLSVSLRESHSTHSAAPASVCTETSRLRQSRRRDKSSPTCNKTNHNILLRLAYPRQAAGPR